MKLYEYKNEIKKLIDESVDPETGELSQEASEQLDLLYSNKLEKISDVVFFIKNEQSFVDAIDVEVKKLNDKKKFVINRVNFLKDYIKRNINEGEKIDQPSFTISWRKSESVEVDIIMDLEELHKTSPEIIKQNISYSVDKVKAKEIFKKTGILPEGISIVQKNNLQIK